MQRRNLEYFVTVVDCGSISAAAQKLFVAQPSLSRAINAMERQMDCRLLSAPAGAWCPPRQGGSCTITAVPFWISSRCWTGCTTGARSSW